MNVSSSTVGSAASASGMSRFDEVDEIVEGDYHRNRSSGDYFHASPESGYRRSCGPWNE